MGFKLLKKVRLTDQTTEYSILHPELAQKAMAGQFVMIRLYEGGERIPLTIADFDKKQGSITLVVQEIGKTSNEMANLQIGDEILDILGPLGHPTPINNYGTVICIGGGLGIATIYPIARALKKAGNTVLTIIGARNKNLLFWEKKLASVSDEYFTISDDGSTGRKGVVTLIQKELLQNRKINKIFAIGPAIMMKFVVETSRPFNTSTIVSLNSIMVDGTGMCGSCRVSVGGETKFVCVDGPDFEGLDVDFENLMARQDYYKTEEKNAMLSQTCRLSKFNSRN